MSDDARRLRDEQAARADTEERLAEGAREEEETLAHERRAEKAEYLREKLEQRLDSEDA
jgi:hypothetical protein